MVRIMMWSCRCAIMYLSYKRSPDPLQTRVSQACQQVESAITARLGDTHTNISPTACTEHTMLIVCTCCNFSSKWPYLQNSQDHSIEPKIYITDKDVSRRLVVMPCQNWLYTIAALPSSTTGWLQSISSSFQMSNCCHS